MFHFNHNVVVFCFITGIKKRTYAAKIYDANNEHTKLVDNKC